MALLPSLPSWFSWLRFLVPDVPLPGVCVYSVYSSLFVGFQRWLLLLPPCFWILVFFYFSYFEHLNCQTLLLIIDVTMWCLMKDQCCHHPRALQPWCITVTIDGCENANVRHSQIRHDLAVFTAPVSKCKIYVMPDSDITLRALLNQHRNQTHFLQWKHIWIYLLCYVKGHLLTISLLNSAGISPSSCGKADYGMTWQRTGWVKDTWGRGPRGRRLSHMKPLIHHFNEMS